MSSESIKGYVADRIKMYRKAAGLTQKELGEKIGVKHNTVSSYESGINEPEQDMLFKIASALGISINDLFPPTDGVDPDLADVIQAFNDNEDFRLLARKAIKSPRDNIKIAASVLTGLNKDTGGKDGR